MSNRYKYVLAAQVAVLFLAMWCCSGTRNIWDLHLGFKDAVLDAGCGWPLTPDYSHFYATFKMIDLQNPGTWAWSQAISRVLYPVLAYVPMKVMGYVLGGFFTNLWTNALALIGFAELVRRRLRSERAALLSAALLATFPPTLYWAGTPFAYSITLPCILASFAILLSLDDDACAGLPWRRFLALGVLFTGYDIFPFFVPTVLALLWRHRRLKLAPQALALMAAPQLLAGLVQWRLGAYRNGTHNNSAFFTKTLSAYAHLSFDASTLKALVHLPVDLIGVFFASNLTFVPLLFLVALGLAPRLKPRLKLEFVEKALLASALLVFLVVNLSPPTDHGFSYKGLAFPRIYQPIVAALLYFVARAVAASPSKPKDRPSPLIVAVLVTVSLQTLVAFGPVTGQYWPQGIYNQMSGVFFDYSGEPMRATAEHWPLRLLGPCSTPLGLKSD